MLGSDGTHLNAAACVGRVEIGTNTKKYCLLSSTRRLVLGNERNFLRHFNRHTQTSQSCHQTCSAFNCISFPVFDRPVTKKQQLEASNFNFGCIYSFSRLKTT